MKPSLQFLVLIAKNPEKIFDNIITMENNRIKGKHHILKYFQDNNNNKNGHDDLSEENKKMIKKKQKQQINEFIEDINDIADMIKKNDCKKIKKSQNKEAIDFDVKIE